MVHPPSVRGSLVPLLLITVLALRGLLVLPFWAVVGEMSLIATDIALCWGCLEHYSSGEWHWDFQHGVYADHPIDSAAVDADYHSATGSEGSDPGSID
jgi:hypothetical protein